MENLPLTLKPSKLTQIVLFLICLGFVFLGFNIMSKNLGIAILNIILFGIGTIVFTINLFPKSSYLKITDKGIEMRTMFRSTFIPWYVINGFSTKRIMFNKMVMIDFNEKYVDVSKLRSKTGALPDTYGMSGEKLAEKLNAIREQIGKVNP